MMRLAGPEFSYGTPSRFRSAKLAVIVALHVLALYALSREQVQTQIARVIHAQIVSIDLPEAAPMAASARESVQRPRTTEPPKHRAAPAVTPSATPSIEQNASESPAKALDAAREFSSKEVALAPVAAVAVSVPPVAAPVVQPASPPVTRVELPSSSADYLQNPAPAYPAQSKRLGEQGRVLLHVYVAETGAAERVELKQSCGFDRLDEAAIAAVKRWKFVPGKRNGVAEAMWVNVPIVFALG